MEDLSNPIDILGEKCLEKKCPNNKHIFYSHTHIFLVLSNIVNNVGIFYDYPEEMAKVSSDTVWNLVMTNVASMTMMTHMLIDKMKQRKKGVIVNISSACSITPCGYGCLYAATKVGYLFSSRTSRFSICTATYVVLHYKLMHMCHYHFIFHFQSFAQSLTWGIQRECAPYGINVQLLSPYVVSTKILHYPKTTNIFVPNVVSYCRWAIFTLLKTNETTGYWSHAIQVLTLSKIYTYQFHKIS